MNGDTKVQSTTSCLRERQVARSTIFWRFFAFVRQFIIVQFAHRRKGYGSAGRDHNTAVHGTLAHLQYCCTCMYLVYENDDMKSVQTFMLQLRPAMKNKYQALHIGKKSSLDLSRNIRNPVYR